MRLILGALIIVCIVTTLGFAYIFFTLVPKLDGNLVVINLVYFFVVGFVSLASLATLVLYSAGSFLERKSRVPTQAVNRPKLLLRVSLRRGVLLSGVIWLLLTFRLLGISNPINVALLILVTVLAEAYFTSGRA